MEGLDPFQQKTLQEYVVRHRRGLHQIPELGTILPETSRFVASELDRLGFSYTEIVPNGGIIADIPGVGPGKTVALRADMDALPIEEKTGLSFASRTPGMMHACGHDAHMAMLLGAARLLRRRDFDGTVRLLFQTGEESAMGSLPMIAAGCLEGVDAIFGMHIGTLLGERYPSGTVVVPEGACMASADRFTLTITGFGCHGSSPEKGIDPIYIASHVIQGLQAIVARELPAAQPAVLSFGLIRGGSQYNQIPGEVILEGTTRSVNQEVRKKLNRRVEEVSAAVAAAFGGQCACEMEWGAPPVINDSAMAALAAQAVREVLPGTNVVEHIEAPNMGGEDFASYLVERPGAYLFLSTYDRERGTAYPHHCERFDVDEEQLWKGSAIYAAIARRFLSER